MVRVGGSYYLDAILASDDLVANVLITLGQFAGVDAMLIAPLAGNSEGSMLVRELQQEGVNTRFCKIWEGAGVPSAWVLESGKKQ